MPKVAIINSYEIQNLDQYLQTLKGVRIYKESLFSRDYSLYNSQINSSEYPYLTASLFNLDQPYTLVYSDNNPDVVLVRYIPVEEHHRTYDTGLSIPEPSMMIFFGLTLMLLLLKRTFNRRTT